MAKEVAMDLQARRNLCSLIEKVTLTTDMTLDTETMKAIKAIVRTSDDNVRNAFEILQDRLKKKHSQVRYLTVLAIDELFMRSKLFRSLLTTVFESYLLLTIGYRSEQPLPPPASAADALRKKSIEILEKWNDKFGTSYSQIRLGYRYLKDTLRMKFPNVREREAAAEQERREREERTRQLLVSKYESLKIDFPEQETLCVSTMKEIDEAVAILLVPLAVGPADFAAPHTVKKGGCGNNEAAVEQSEMEMEAEGFSCNDPDAVKDATDESRKLRYQHMEISMDDIAVTETRENAAIFESLQDLHKLVSVTYLPMVAEWASVLTRVESEEREERNVLLKKVIDLRNQLKASVQKCEVLGVHKRRRNSLEVVGDGGSDPELGDVTWETGNVETEALADAAGGEEGGKQESRKGAGGSHDSLVAIKPGTTSEPHQQGKDDTESNAANHRCFVRKQQGLQNACLSDDRKDLLSMAPRVSWGHDLEVWGKEDYVPVNNRGLTLETHWGSFDPDVCLPPERVVELNMRVSYYEPGRVGDGRRNPACGAPLRNGGFCTRKDLIRCPFHGLIVPRNEKGEPLAAATDTKRTSEDIQGGAVSSKVVKVSAEDPMDGNRGTLEDVVDANYVPVEKIDVAGLLSSQAQSAASEIPLRSSCLPATIPTEVGTCHDVDELNRMENRDDDGTSGLSVKEYHKILARVAAQAHANVQQKKKAVEVDDAGGNNTIRSSRNGKGIVRSRLASSQQRRLDRQHNAAMLRMAAMEGSTTGLERDAIEEALVRGSQSRRGRTRKASESNRLLLTVKPKETAKDRIVKRLLAPQVVASTIREFQREDNMKYKMSGMNRW